MSQPFSTSSALPAEAAPDAASVPTPPPAPEPAKADSPNQRPRPSAPKPGLLPPYHVVLLNDDDHTFEYVIEMLQRLMGHSRPIADQMAKKVDRQGRAIVLTTHRERAELKRDQIRGYGGDRRVEGSKRSMKAIIEPAEAS